MLRLMLAILFLAPFQATPQRLRILVRGDQNQALVGVTLMIQTADGQQRTLITGADGVASGDGLTGPHITITAAMLVDGTRLTIQPMPRPDSVGMQLNLIPGQVRDVLLRLDGTSLIADPDMIFSPNEPGEPTVAALPTLAVAAATQAAMIAPTSLTTATSTQASAPTATRASVQPGATGGFPWGWVLMGSGALLLLALGIGLLGRRVR